MEEVRGLYEYESDDADSGEFTYFCMAPDTNTTTYHIEFRYGSDLDALGQYDAGDYAYWLASGISTDCDQAMIENCIQHNLHTTQMSLLYQLTESLLVPKVSINFKVISRIVLVIAWRFKDGTEIKPCNP